MDATQTSDYTQILPTTRCTVCTAVTSQLGFIQCWAPEEAYSVRQDSQLLGLQASEGPPQGWQTWDSSSGNVQSLQWQYAKPDLSIGTSYDSTHSPLTSRNMFSSLVWAPFPPTFPPHVYYKWKSISLLMQVHIYASNHIKKPFDISVFFLGGESHMSRTWLLRHACKRDFISRVVFFWFSEG